MLVCLLVLFLSILFHRCCNFVKHNSYFYCPEYGKSNNSSGDEEYNSCDWATKFRTKDVRAHCYCASLLRTQIHTPRHASSARGRYQLLQLCADLTILDVQLPLLFFPETDFIYNYLHIVQKRTKHGTSNPVILRLQGAWNYGRLHVIRTRSLS